MIVRSARVGRYEIEDHLASGGMAEVYRARDTESGAIVALKIPHDGEEIWQAERSGASLQMELSRHDSRVPAVHEIGDDGERFVAMEYVEGEDLSRCIKHGPLEWREATRITIELCGVLTTARSCSVHGNGDAGGIVHGDIKPRNVRVQHDGRIKVLDFGIAKALRKARVETRNLYGSVPYSSPERLDRARVDFHSDLWSVAVVLYEMLEGQRPVRSAAEEELERVIRSGARPEPLGRLVPRALQVVLEKALARSIGERYESAADLKADLEAVLEGAVTVAERESVLRPVESWPGLADDGDDAATRRTLPDGGLDDAATRRTLGPGAEADEATRRTLVDGAMAPTIEAAPVAGVNGASAVGAATASAALARPARESFLAVFVRRWRRVPWKILVVLAIVIFSVREFNGLTAAADLRATLPTRPRGEAQQVWNEYRRVTRSHLLTRVSGLGAAVRDWLVFHADDLISRYRSDTPSIWENGWRSAQSLLERGATLDPGNRRIRARLEYCRAHLNRIAARDNPKRGASMAQYDEAVGRFQRSASLWPGWPDPYIGLAQVFAYGKKNPDRTSEALDKARQAGYPMGEREVAVLGDAYRLRAERFRATPTRDFDSNQRYHHLERIRDDCLEALALYETVPAYGDVTRYVRGLRQRLTEVEDEMRGLEGGPSPYSQ